MGAFVKHRWVACHSVRARRRLDSTVAAPGYAEARRTAGRATRMNWPARCAGLLISPNSIAQTFTETPTVLSARLDAGWGRSSSTVGVDAGTLVKWVGKLVFHPVRGYSSAGRARRSQRRGRRFDPD